MKTNVLFLYLLCISLTIYPSSFKKSYYWSQTPQERYCTMLPLPTHTKIFVSAYLDRSLETVTRENLSNAEEMLNNALEEQYNKAKPNQDEIYTILHSTQELKNKSNLQLMLSSELANKYYEIQNEILTETIKLHVQKQREFEEEKNNAIKKAENAYKEQINYLRKKVLKTEIIYNYLAKRKKGEEIVDAYLYKEFTDKLNDFKNVEKYEQFLKSYNQKG